MIDYLNILILLMQWFVEIKSKKKKKKKIITPLNTHFSLDSIFILKSLLDFSIVP
jgi:hypothetical protein